MTSPEDRMDDVERAQHVGYAAAQVQKFADTIVRMYAAEHPNDPIVAGHKAAKDNLTALVEGGVIRGHLRLVEQMTVPE